MQFGGQRTDMDLNPIGEPINVLIKLTEDILPEPDAVLVTGITPQKTLAEGVTEAEFGKIFQSEIVRPGTIFVGFNSIRFDDEFMRFFLFRNFYDAYEWQWKDGCSRWDMLDVSRMARALRPEGLKWPFDPSGKPTNRLEFLASINKLAHDNAHDALSDVNATIALAQKLKQAQPKLFDYMLSMRDKRKVKALVKSGQPFVYSSGKYPGEFEKTTVAITLGPHPDKQSDLVYDLRHDPKPILKLSAEQLAEKWKYNPNKPDDRLPVKSLQFNRCPAVAPSSVLDVAATKRLKLDMEVIKKHQDMLKADPSFISKLHGALEILNKNRQTSLVPSDIDVDASLYNEFVPDSDRQLQKQIHQIEPSKLTSFASKFGDARLKALLPLYKARNFPSSLTPAELESWEDFKERKLQAGGASSQAARFNKRLSELIQQPKLTKQQKYLLEEINLYAQSVIPGTDA